MTTNPLAVDRVTPLDALLPAALSRETELDGLINPGLGWFLLTLTALDLIGNLLGLPVVTGTIAAACGVPIGVYGISALVSFQIFVLVVALNCLYRSPWRLWGPQELASARGGDGKFHLVQLPGLSWLGRQWERVISPPTATTATSDPARGGLVMFAGLLIVVVVAVGVVWPVGLPVILLVGIGAVARPLARVLYVLIRRAVTDTSSMTGLVIGVAVALGLLLLVANGMGAVQGYFERSWTEPAYGWFRTGQLFVLSALLGWVVLLPGARLNTDIPVLVGEPTDRARVYYDLGNFLSFVGRRVVVQFDRSLARDVIVLVRQPDNGFRAVDPALPLELQTQPYLVLYLPGLRNSLANGAARVPLVDARGLFRPSAELVASPRAPGPADLPTTFPPLALDPLLGLLASRDPVGELRQLAQDAFDDFAARVSETGAKMDVRFRQLEWQVDAVPLALNSGINVGGNLLALDAVKLEASLTEQEQKETALVNLQACQQQGAALVENWLNAMALQLSAAPGVRTAFAARFGATFGGPDPAGRALAARLGIGLVVTLAPEVGGAPRGEAMLAALNDRCRQVRDQVISDIKQTREQNIRFVADMLKLRHERELVAVKALLGMLPEFLPYFRNRPEQLMRFLSFAVGQSADSPERMKQALAAFATGAPAP